MFTNTALSPQPLPSCHLVLHSGICLNPLSELKPIPPCLQTQLFLPQTLLSCHLVFHSGICLNPLSQLKPIRNVYKHSFFSPIISLLSSCLPQWYMLISSQPNETYPAMFTNTAFSPQPLPSCHLFFHSGICLKPPSLY